jgi:hypothetical protein
MEQLNTALCAKGFKTMKKLFGIMLLALYALSVAAGGAAVTSTSWAGGFSVDAPSGYFGTPAKSSQDTMTQIDTSNLAIKIAIPSDANKMILAISDSLGAADSIKIEYIVYDKVGTRVLAQAVLDTLTPSTSYKEFQLPFNSTVFGSFFTLRAIQMSNASSIKSFIKSWAVYIMSPYTGYKIKL